MAEGLDEHHRIVGGVLIVMRGLCHKLCRLVFLQFPHRHHLQNGIKNDLPIGKPSIYLYERKSHAARSLAIMFFFYCCIAQAMAWPSSLNSISPAALSPIIPSQVWSSVRNSYAAPK